MVVDRTDTLVGCVTAVVFGLVITRPVRQENKLTMAEAVETTWKEECNCGQNAPSSQANESSQGCPQRRARLSQEAPLRS